MFSHRLVDRNARAAGAAQRRGGRPSFFVHTSAQPRCAAADVQPRHDARRREIGGGSGARQVWRRQSGGRGKIADVAKPRGAAVERRSLAVAGRELLEMPDVGVAKLKRGREISER